ncbi:germinal-center associated nuclear protein [Anthonomus grandis grandis]|uniref:germinal-center associated nuclear protein n=1 Tax=Anthonomus grandis grandis TaxID=2921223 RepID=UPI00216546A5|nr:germinal-center associated nuclear protein [Anthonomus grandis grandis]
MQTSYIKGECTDMCPPAERELRKNERLIHILELSPDSKPERERMVKCFVRSAAGKDMHDPKNLRTPETLLKTVNYLVIEILPNKVHPAHLTFDFITDRLRSVRQDMVIQNLPMACSICLLQPIVRLYAYATYRLCEEPIANFDPYINKTHLQECLKRLLCLYDECDRMFGCENDDLKNASFMKVLEQNRPLFEAMYLVLNLGNTIALTRALSLPKMWKTDVVIMAISLSRDYNKNNFVRVCQGFYKIPTLLKGLAAIHLPEIRRKAFKVMSVAYNSKHLTFPMIKLKEMLLYDKKEVLKQDLKSYGFKFDQCRVHFLRTDYVEPSNPLPPKHINFIDEEFKDVEIPDLILNIQ